MPEENDNDNIAEENEEQNFTVENPSLDLEVSIAYTTQNSTLVQWF